MLTAPPFIATLTGPTPCAAAPRLFDEDAPRTARAIARSLCAGCPVRTTCGQHALDSPAEHGVWGGLDDADRRQARYARARASRDTAAPPPLECGTLAAYQRHRRYGETCQECADAERARMVARLDATHRAIAAGAADTGWAYELERRLGLEHCAGCREWCRTNSARRRAREHAQRAASAPTAPVVALRPNGRQKPAQRFEAVA